MYNLHQYLFLTFKKAIRDAFFDVNLKGLPLRFYISNEDSFDICTPVARRLQSVIKSESANSIASQLLHSIDWNYEYILSDDLSAIVTNGFINLTISRYYLQKLLLKENPLNLHSNIFFLNCQLDYIFKKLKRLTDNGQILGIYDLTLANPSVSLLSHRLEHKILVLLAILEFQDTLSGKLFIIDKLLKIAHDYYLAIPLIPDCSMLSKTRFLLIRRLLEETHQCYTNP